MQQVEKRALATCRQTTPLWLRCVENTFTDVHKDDAFRDHLNEHQFTKETEQMVNFLFYTVWQAAKITD